MSSSTTPPHRSLAAISTCQRKLRTQGLSQRKALSQEERFILSERITATCLNLPDLVAMEHIFIYVAYRSEVETKPLISTFVNQGKRVYVPLVSSCQQYMKAVEIRNPEQDLCSGFRGIPEPVPALHPENTDSRTCPAHLGMAICPGAVFSTTGGRVGYGGGFYDRFLAQEAPQARRVGLCFSCQIVKDMPLAPHDMRMDIVITEKNIYPEP